MSERLRASSVVGGLRARLAAGRLLQLLCALASSVALAALVIVLLDATIILPEDVRVAVPWALGAVAAAVLVVGLAGLRHLSADRVACSLERSDPSLGTALTNAVQLARRSERAKGKGASAVDLLLRREAVEHGRRRARQARAWPSMRRGVLAALTVAAASALCCLLAPFIWPDVFDAVLPRLTDPHGDHPPYSRTRIAVQPGNIETIYGSQCAVRAVVSGEPAEKLFLVTEDSAGQARSTMYLSPDRSFVQTLTNLREPTVYYVTDGRTRSRRHRIDIQYTPQITLVEVAARYPDYTGWKPTAGKLNELPGQELRVPPATEIKLRMASNRPLKGGTVELTPLLGGDVQRVTLTPDAATPNVVTGSWRADQAAAFSLGVTDVDGLASVDPVKGRVVLLPDRRPRITVLEPGRRVLATPDVAVPVRVRAEDDYGIADVLWFRGLNRSLERRTAMDLAAASGSRAKVRCETQLDMADLGVRPGDTIQFFFEALDNYPDGPHVTTTTYFTVEIISRQQYEMMLRQRAAQQGRLQRYHKLADMLRRIQERAAALAGREKELAEAGRASEKDRRDPLAEARAVHDELGEYLKTLEKVLADPTVFDVEDAFHKRLSEQAANVAQARAELGSMLGRSAGGKPLDPEALQKLAEALQGQSALGERQVGAPARELDAAVDLMAQANRFAQLAVQQKRVARLAERFRSRSDELSRVEQMELQELAAEERRISENLSDLLEKILAGQARLPDESRYDQLRSTVDDFIDAVNAAGIRDDLDGAAGHFSGSEGPAGHGLARSAAEKMDRLVARCQPMSSGDMQMECLKFQPALQTLGESAIQQVLNAAASLGTGGSGTGGYGLYGQDVGLYGPDVQLPGGEGGGRGLGFGEAAASGQGVAASDAVDPQLDPVAVRPARVRIQRDAKFPLSYRELVGEYFRAIAETEIDRGPAAPRQ